MAYPKGKPRPPNSGRKKGTPNKTRVDLLDEFEKRNFDVVSAFIESLAAQPEYMRCDTLIKVFKYIFHEKKPDESPMQGTIIATGTTMSKEQMIEVMRAARGSKTPSVD